MGGWMRGWVSELPFMKDAREVQPNFALNIIGHRKKILH
jgi:hypothetical protein